ncbi:MAG: hypothetical protein SGBAC_009488 [Bacillariaceae sp.]
MAPIRAYFPSGVNDGAVPVVFTKRRGKRSTHLHHDPKWESLIEKASASYRFANDKCKVYIVQGIINEMQEGNPTGQFYHFHNNGWSSMSPEEMLELTQKALVNTEASRKRKSNSPEPPELENLLESNRAARTPTGEKTAAIDFEKLKKKYASILRVVANGSLTQADQNSQIYAIATDAITYILRDSQPEEQAMDIADYDSDDDSTAPNRRRKKQQRLAMEEYYSTGGEFATASEVACGGTVATKLLDNGLMAGVAEFEPNSAMASCKMVRDWKIKDDRQYTGSTLHQKPHGIGFMKYKDGRVTCGNWHSGTLHGHVIALYVNGDTYIGGYLKNKRNGVGLYRYKDGAKYDGIFERDERHGRGIYTTKEGYAYDGTFVQGRFEGQGVRRSPNGSEQRGRFENWVYTE